MRNYYFHGLHSWDLTATQRDLHEKLHHGQVSERIYRECIDKISLMKWTTEVSDETLWRDLYNERLYVQTPEWFTRWGIEAGLPDDDSDLEDQFMGDAHSQRVDGNMQDFDWDPEDAEPIPYDFDDVFDPLFERAMVAVAERIEVEFQFADAEE